MEKLGSIQENSFRKNTNENSSASYRRNHFAFTLKFLKQVSLSPLVE